jgi:hypothetical protein
MTTACHLPLTVTREITLTMVTILNYEHNRNNSRKIITMATDYPFLQFSPWRKLLAMDAMDETCYRANHMME